MRRTELKHWSVLVVGGLVVVAAAVAGFVVSRRGPQPTAVQTATVARADLQAKVKANGKVKAQRKLDISATIAGQITHLAVKEGDRVRKGQLLLQIDTGAWLGAGASAVSAAESRPRSVWSGI